MSKALCSVCEVRYLDTKPHICDSCENTYMLCSVCDDDRHPYWKRPQRRRDYCPECNEKLENGELAET